MYCGGEACLSGETSRKSARYYRHMALPRLLYAAAKNFKRAWPLMRDERVPTGLKAVMGILALLIISPLDIFGDIPILGLLDDAVLLTLLCMLFVWLATQTIEKNVTPVKRSAISGAPMVRNPHSRV
jgi:uncharacterized membrane protein YkvA (DUF1232 family)